MSRASAAVLQQGEGKLESGQNGAQVVAHPVQHGGALFHGALDAPLHLEEGIGRLAHLARTLWPEFEIAALAEVLGGDRKAQNRADLIAQKGDGDADQHQRRAEHPHQEDMRIRRIDGVAVGDDAQHRIIEQDLDFDEIGASDRVDPVGAVELAGEFARQGIVEQREKGLRQRGRQFLLRQDVDVELKAVGGDLAQFDAAAFARIGIVEIDDGADILDDAGRQAERDRLPMAFHEEIGDHRLQDHHRQDDDQQRACVEPFGHETRDPAGEIAPAGQHALQRDAMREVQAARGFLFAHRSTTSL